MCWYNISDADRVDGLFKMTVNDPAERYYGAMTGQLQYYGKIGLTNPRGVSQVRVNDEFSHEFDNSCKNINTKQVEGIFRNLSEKMKLSLAKMCIYDAPAARAADQS